MKSKYGYLTAESARYARVLYELSIPSEAVEETKQILEQNPELIDILANPTIAGERKERIIDRIFPAELRSFLKVTCRNHRIGGIDEILEAYERYCDEQKKRLRATLLCVDVPDEKQKAGIEDFLKKKYGAESVSLVIEHDPKLYGGFILRTGSDEYDWSMRGRLERLRQKLG